MSDACPACEERRRVHGIQMEGRRAAAGGLDLGSNPHSDEVDRQYWEYGWLEENFMEEIEGHRAVIRYAGEHLFSIGQQLSDMLTNGLIAQSAHDRLLSSLSTVSKNLADKLQES